MMPTHSNLSFINTIITHPETAKETRQGVTTVSFRAGNNNSIISKVNISPVFGKDAPGAPSSNTSFNSHLL